MSSPIGSSTRAEALARWQQSLPISLPDSLPRERLLAHGPFQAWLATMHRCLALQHSQAGHAFAESPYALERIEVQSVDYFGGRRIGFVKFVAHVANARGETVPGIVFLRGASVAILVILHQDAGQNGQEGGGRGGRRGGGQGDGQGDEAGHEGGQAAQEWAVLTVQPRIPAGSLQFVELPAGMLDEHATFAGAAARELREECGITIAADQLVDLTQMALGPVVADHPERLAAAVYPSPGGSDEHIKLFAYRHRIAPGTLAEWRGKLTGLREHGEMISLKLVPLADLWRATVDAKALCAAALWQGLRADGRL